MYVVLYIHLWFQLRYKTITTHKHSLEKTNKILNWTLNKVFIWASNWRKPKHVILTIIVLIYTFAYKLIIKRYSKEALVYKTVYLGCAGSACYRPCNLNTKLELINTCLRRKQNYCIKMRSMTICCKLQLY